MLNKYILYCFIKKYICKNFGTLYHKSKYKRKVYSTVERQLKSIL